VINIDINIIKGNYSTTQLTALTTSGTPFNLSGYFLTGGSRFRYDTSGNLMSFAPYSPIQESGIVNINLTSETTSQCPVGSYYYGIDAFNNNNQITLFQGFLNISPNIFFVGGSGVLVEGAPVQGYGSGIYVGIVKQLIYSHGAPTGAPPFSDSASICYDLDSFQMYLWNPETQSW
jgi:hypothetical protein